MAFMVTAGLSNPAQGVRTPPATLTGSLHNVTATDLAANDLGANPTLAPGARVIIAVSGFAPRAAVQWELASGASGQPLGAGSNGVIRVVYQVPRTITPGRYTLGFIGDGPADPGPPPTSTPGAMTISVVIPNHGEFDFTVAWAPHRP